MQLKLFLHFLVVLGNFKARPGPDDALFTHNSVSNDSGKLMLEIMEDYDMLATNTLFRKKKGKLWTWNSPQNTTHQIDYILTHRKWKECP